MKQFKLTFLLTVLMSMVGARAMALKFEVVNDDGKTIYYWKINDTEVGVTYKGSFANEYANEYTGSIIIPESVTYDGVNYIVTRINDTAFKNCNNLTSVSIPNSVTRIGWEAFYGCSSLSSINIANSVNYIGYSAFESCSSLTSVTIPNSVTSISQKTFYNTYLESLTIGAGVLSIADNAFDYDYISQQYKGKKPTKVIWLTNTPPSGYANVGGTVNYVANDLYTSLNNKTVYPFLSSMFEAGGVKYVPVSPSERTCDAIDCVYSEVAEHINIGTTVSYMGIDMTVLDVKPYVCYKNKYINDVQLTCNANISDYAFSGCTNVTTITASNQGDIGYHAFSFCKSVTTINVSNQGNIGAWAFADITGSLTATVNNVGSIGGSAFYNCWGLTNLEIGTNVTSIGSQAFTCCNNLKNVTIPDAVIELGSYAFHNCKSIESVSIGNGLKTINEGAFLDCSSLTELIIPENVTSINDRVFDGCSQLTKVTMADSQEQLFLGSNESNPLFASCPLDEVYIGRNISYDTSSSKGYSPFYRNTSLRAVTITDKETEISENEFYGCTNLKQITIGDGVTTIGDWAFSGCSSLESFSFGYSVETIGQEAFSDCTAMTTIVSRSQTPPICGTQALDDINKFTCKLQVPQGYLSVYQQADQWKEFFFIEDVVEVVLPTVTAEDKTREYGEENPELTYTVTDGELTGVPVLTTEAVKTSPVGTYDIVVNKGSITGKYNAVNGTLTVNKAPLTITAKNYTIKQGQPLQEFEATYEGFKNNETESVLTVKPTFTTAATSASEPGEYEITVSGAEAGNYKITYVKGKLTIVEADPVTVTAKSYTREYGEQNPVFEYTVEGAALEGEPQITCEATATSPVGTYDIVITKGSVTNYNVTFVNGTLTVTAKPVTENNVTITGIPTTVEEGQEPDLSALSITCDGRALTQGVDYTVSVDTVNGIITITFIGNYSGVVTVQYEIVTGIGFITADDDDVEWYTLNGQRIETPRKGTYIMRKNGVTRTVVIK